MVFVVLTPIYRNKTTGAGLGTSVSNIGSLAPGSGNRNTMRIPIGGQGVWGLFAARPLAGHSRRVSDPCARLPYDFKGSRSLQRCCTKAAVVVVARVAGVEDEEGAANRVERTLVRLSEAF